MRNFNYRVAFLALCLALQGFAFAAAELTDAQKRRYRALGIDLDNEVIQRYDAEDWQRIDDYIARNPSADGIGGLIHQISSSNKHTGNPNYRVRNVNGAQVISNSALDQRRQNQRSENIRRLEAEIRARQERIVGGNNGSNSDVNNKGNSNVNPSSVNEGLLEAGRIETLRGPTAADVQAFQREQAQIAAGQAQRFPGVEEGREAGRLAEIDRLQREADEAAARADASRVQHQQIQAGKNPTMRGPTAEQVQAYQREQAQIEASSSPTLRGPTAEEVQAYQREQARIEASSSPTLRGPTAEEVQAYQREQARIEASSSPTLRGPTAEDVQAFQAEQARIREQAQIEASSSPTMRGPTAEQVQAYQREQAQIEASSSPTMRGPTAEQVQAYQREQAQIEAGNIETLRGPTAEDIQEHQANQANADEQARIEAGRIETLRGPTAEQIQAHQTEQALIEAGQAQRFPNVDEGRKAGRLAEIDELERDANEAVERARDARRQHQLIEAGSIETLRGPTAEDVQAAQAEQAQIEAGSIETLRGPTAEDVQAHQREQAQIEAGKIETLRGPTAADIQASRGISTSTDHSARIDANNEVIAELRAELDSIKNPAGRESVQADIARIEEENQRLQSEQGNGSTPEPVMCTEDAMQCPDGSVVGRTGPNCEFVCPEVRGIHKPADITLDMVGDSKRINCAERARDCNEAHCNENSYMRCMDGESIDQIIASPDRPWNPRRTDPALAKAAADLVGDTTEQENREAECARIRTCRASWCGAENYNRCLQGTSIEEILGGVSPAAEQRCLALRNCRAAHCGQESYNRCLAELDQQDDQQPEELVGRSRGIGGPTAEEIQAHQRENENSRPAQLSDVLIDVQRGIQGVDYSQQVCRNGRCGPRTVNIRPGSKIRIRGEKPGGMYDIDVYDRNGDYVGRFQSAKRYVDRAINWNAVQSTIDGLGTVNSTVDPITGECVTRDSAVQPAMSASHVSDRIVQTPEVDTSGEYLEGCEVLRNTPLTEEHKNDLMTCSQNIQAVAVQGVNVSRSSPEYRQEIFKNLFRKLNPREQQFAARLFTTHGEAANLSTYDHMMVMKVLENRTRLARNRASANDPNKENYNELDIALSPWHFSMYNPAEPGWRRIFEPGHADPMTDRQRGNIIDSIIRYEAGGASIHNSVTNEVYQYHNNHVSPDWGDTFRRQGITPSRMSIGGGETDWQNRHSYHLFYVTPNGSGVGIGNYRNFRRSSVQ